MSNGLDCRASKEEWLDLVFEQNNADLAKRSQDVVKLWNGALLYPDEVLEVILVATFQREWYSNLPL